MGRNGAHLRRRSAIAGAAGALAASGALGLWPSAAAPAAADRGAIAYTQFDTITTVGEAGGPSLGIGLGSEPAWSPEGRRMAYFTGPAFGPYTGVTVLEADGRRHEVLRVYGGGVVSGVAQDGSLVGVITNFDLSGVTDRERLSGLAWSPDGRAVRLGVITGPGQTLLIRVDVTTGETGYLGSLQPPRGATARELAWSPAGRLVAFSAAVTTADDPGCGPDESRVYAYRLRRFRPSPLRRLAPRKGLCFGERVDLRLPAFSPDGTKVVVTRRRPPLPGATVGRSDLLTIDVGPGGRPQNDPRATARGLTGAYAAVFSPDGQRIAYLFGRNDSAFTGGIGVMRADGTGRRDVRAEPALVLWSLDWGYRPRT